jgi:uncharacterized membrane protein
MTIARTLLLLALTVWVGGITYFSFVVAPSAFAVLPTRQMAGVVVSRTLGAMHWIGLVCGVVIYGSQLALDYHRAGYMQFFNLRQVVVLLMIAATLFSLFVITPKMTSLRADMKEIDTVPHDDPRRVEFNKLHRWSTRAGGTVLFLGLALVVLTARRLT